MAEPKVTNTQLVKLAEIVGILIGENESLKSGFQSLKLSVSEFIQTNYPDSIEDFEKNFLSHFDEFLISNKRKGASRVLSDQQNLYNFLKKFGRDQEN